MKLNAMLLTDFYKTIHHLAYVEGLDYLVTYWTPRMSRIEGVDKVVMFGLQAAIKKYLIEDFNENFFNRPKEEVVKEYQRIIRNTMTEQAANTDFLEELHDLGYLPIQIKAVEEGTRVNIKTPMFEIRNTVKGFGWLVNYLETLISCNVWHPMTSASIAYQFREVVNKYFDKTVSDKGAKNSACGDFSMRGMPSVDAAMASGAAHLTSFVGTATISAVSWLEEYYNADCEKEVVGKGTPSTEHSVMSSYGREGEFDCYKRLITEVFPKGNLSIVSDTYDYWNVLTNYLPKLKEDILARDGKIIIRGDSGNPVDIICGIEKTKNNVLETLEDFEALKHSRSIVINNEVFVKENNSFYRWVGPNNTDWKCMGNESSPEWKGTVEILWDIFGGYINEKGYKVLDSHIGAIYGDSITIERAELIYKELEEKGFAVNNCILGIGSWTYLGKVSRDTLSFALKATHSIINSEEKQIYKDPKTDNDRFKKSQRGMCYVYRDGEDILYKDELSLLDIEHKAEYENNLLRLVFKNGKLLKDFTLIEVRENLHKGCF